VKLGVNDLKKYLTGKSEKDLKEEIIELFKISKEVKEYFAIKVLPNAENELLDKYKEIVIKEFFPERGTKFPNYSVLKKAVSGFGKVAQDSVLLADLMLFYVEQGVEFTNTYGDIDETFYNNIARMYERAIDLIVKDNLEDKFERRCQEVMVESRGIGWGFEEIMAELYYSNFDVSD
jgi:hypothetical protein